MKPKGSEKIGHLVLKDITKVRGPVLEITQINTWSGFGMKAGLIPQRFFASESFPAHLLVRFADCTFSQGKRLTVSSTLSQSVPAAGNSYLNDTAVESVADELGADYSSPPHSTIRSDFDIPNDSWVSQQRTLRPGDVSLIG